MSSAWEELDAREARLTAGVTARMLALAGVAAGQRVLDLGAGCGHPSLEAAAIVGPRGRVRGVDPSAPAIAIARRRASALGLAQAEFELGTAEDVAAEGQAFDVVLARWSLGAMTDPAGALARARARLTAGGRAVIAVWCEAERIPWWRVPREITARFAPIPPADPRLPGTLRLAARADLEAVLAASGFALAALEERETDVLDVDDPDDVARWVEAVFPSYAAAVSPAQRAAWIEALAEGARRPDGRCALGGVTRLVTLAP